MFISLLHRIVKTRYTLLGVQSRRTQIGNVNAHYLEYTRADDSPTILLLHGLGTSSASWVKVLPSLLSHHLVAPDLPGFGATKLPNGTLFFPIDELDAFVENFAESVLPQRFVVVGHSLGGWLAMRYTSRHPERVLKLILMNPAGVYYDGVEAQASLFDVHSIADVRRLTHRLWFRYPWYFRPFVRSIYRDLRARGAPDFARSIKEGDFINGSLRNITMPVHIIWGMNDGLISGESLNILERSVPHVEVRRISECGHIPHMERPAEVKNLLKEFLFP
jgi:pimeloyl-ACP methyl ester carboxylesterase